MERLLKTRLIVLLFLAAVALLAFHEGLLWKFTIDDAYIGYRYARRLAQGHGLAWNVGGDPVEGYSNFLWLLLLTLFFRFTPDVILWAKWAGVLFGFANLGLAFLNARLVCKSRTAALLPVFLLALTPAYSAWAVSGMETQMFLSFFLLSLYLFVREKRGNIRFPLSALTLFALALTRVEGVVLFAVLALVRALRKNRTDRFNLVWLFLFVLPYAGYTLWRVRYFGYLIPNATFDKMRIGVDRYGIVDFARFSFPYLFLSAGGLFMRRARDWAVPGVAVALALGVVTQNTDPVMGFYYRYLVPVLAVLFVLSAPAMEGLFEFLKRQNPGGRAAQIALLLFLLVYPALYMRFPWMLTATARMDEEFERHIGLGRWLKGRLPPDASIAMANCGIVPYVSDLETVDIWGLNDERIAREGFDVAYVFARIPTVIILTGDSTEPFRPKGKKDALLHGSPILQAEFKMWRKVPLNPYAAYWVYGRKGIPAP